VGENLPGVFRSLPQCLLICGETTSGRPQAALVIVEDVRIVHAEEPDEVIHR
jgi:hypothetical protein